MVHSKPFVDFSHCPKVMKKIKIERELEEIEKILELFKKDKNIASSKFKNVILVLGVAGSGKSTFTKFVGKTNYYFESQTVESDVDELTTQYLNQTQAVLPGMLEDAKNNVVYYHFPGFSFQPNTVRNIVLGYFIKSVLDSADSVKLIFTIPYSLYVRIGDLEFLFSRASALISDLEKYKKGIALVVTKVEDKFIKDGENSVLMSNQVIINDIVKHLQESRAFTNDTSIVKFIDNLLGKDKDGNKEKIGVLRKLKAVDFTCITLLQRNKEYLINLIHKNVKFIKYDKSDFKYTSLYSNTHQAHQLVDKVDEKLLYELKSIRPEIEKYYYKQEEQSRDIHDLYNKTQSWNDAFSAQPGAISQCADLKCVVNKLTVMIIDHDICPTNEHFSNIKHYFKQLEFVGTLVDVQFVSRLPKWIKEFSTGIQTYLVDSKKWYGFFIYLHDVLSDHDVQRNLYNISTTSSLHFSIVDCQNKENVIITECNFESVIESINPTLINDIKKNYSYINIMDVKLDEVKLEFLNTILNKTVKNKVSYSCEKDNKLSIKGYNVELMSSIADAKCHETKVIEIFALNKILIDGYLDKTGDELQLSIIAPTWEVISELKIILNGKDGEEYPAVPNDGLGRGGRAGKPGGPAGSFLGIGQSFVNAEYLSIIANGGNGGPGENGNDGAEGQDADPFYTVYIPKDGTQASWHSDSCHTYSILEYTQSAYAEVHMIHKKWNGTCLFNDGNCTKGGDGGDGGAGGLGGNNGDILLFLKTDKVNIETHNTKGNRGINGQGGNGMKGGRQFLKLNFLALQDFTSSVGYASDYERFVYTHGTNVERCLPGKNGTAGKSSKNLQNPKPAVTIYSPTIINDYKNYLRENLKNGVVESSLRKFLEYLDKIDEYDTLGYVDELYGLEQQFYKLHKEFPLLPFYESLRKRVKRYAEIIHNDNKTLIEDDRKVLHYLYTAISTKICSINNIAANDFSTNIRVHLDQAVNDIKELKTFKDIARKNSYLSDYEKKMVDKIKEATNYIDTITEEIETVLIQTDANIQKLILATHVKRNESIEETHNLMKQEDELKKTLTLRMALGIPKILSTLLIFLGPAGIAASLVISSGFTIAEYLLLPNTGNTTVSKLTTLPAGVTYSLTKMSDVLKTRQQRIKTQIDDAVKILKDVKPTDQLFDVKRRLKDLSEKVSNLADDDHELAEEIYKEQLVVEASIKSKKEKLEKDAKDMQSVSDKKFTKLLQTIVKLQWILESSLTMSANFYNDIKSHERMIETVRKSTTASQDKTKLLLKYEEKIYHIIIPIYRDLETSFRNSQNSLKGKSNVGLDVSSWQVQSILKDAKSQLERLTADFDEQRDLIDSIRKLQDSMDITIEMYNYIQTYQERKGLGNLVANMNLNQDKEVLSDKKLNNAIDDLKLIIVSNLILEKYENAVDAFKQYVFPFAGVYFTKHDLPAFLQPNDVLGMATEVTKIIKDLKLEIDNYNAGASNYRKDFHKRHVNIKFGCPSNLIESFFVWKYNSYKQEIHKLLDGKEVVLKSDIRQGFDKNAIKFNDIGIQFRFANKKIQNDFDYEINDYEITMVHLGLSYYRCDDKIYTVTSNNTQYISYIAKKNCSEKAEITNMLHDQIRMSQAVLSPYGFWKLKLTHNNGKNKKLDIYKNQEVDLVLEGTGDYVDLDLDVCKDNLTKYYALDDSASEVKYFGFFKHELLYHSFIARSRRHNRVSRSIHQIDDDMQGIEENLVLTNSGCSSVKSSYLSEILNVISNGLIIFKNWMPKTDLLQWFNEGKENVEHEMSPNFNINAYTEIPFLNVEPELPKISNQFTDGESATINSIFGNSSFCTNDNLLFLDLIIRRKSGIKHRQSNALVSREFDAQYAQNLAYGGHLSTND